MERKKQKQHATINILNFDVSHGGFNFSAKMHKKLEISTISFQLFTMKKITLHTGLFLLILLVFIELKAQQSGSIIHNGVERTYIFYTSETQAASQPLLIAMHGYTQTAQGIMQYSHFNQLAESEGFAVVYPQGIGNSWNVGFSGGSTADDLGFIDALIDTLSAEYNIDTDRVYVTGLSNGGFMCYRLAYQLSNKIAAIAAVAGTVSTAGFQSWLSDLPVPVLHIHGTSDFVVPYNGFNEIESVETTLNYWITKNACAREAVIINLPDLVQEGSTVEQHDWSECVSEKPIRLLKIINGGHTWPGSNGSGIGNVNMDISASEMIWNFVKDFSLADPDGLSYTPQSTWKVYPNPLYGNVLSLSDLPADAVEFWLTCPQGNVVFAYTLANSAAEVRIKIPQISQGIYLLHLLTTKQISTKKIVIL
jgi:polyhydroxybutyrate depolymerase